MNEIAIRDDYQPTGLRAFGWGILGFFGANIIINLTCNIGLLILGAVSNAFLLLVGVFGVMGLALYLAYVFSDTRDYRATQTGAQVSIGINSIILVLSFFAELA